MTTSKCCHLLDQLEILVARLLDAEEAGEMGNRDKALEALEHWMERV